MSSKCKSTYLGLRHPHPHPHPHIYSHTQTCTCVNQPFDKESKKDNLNEVRMTLQNNLITKQILKMIGKFDKQITKYPSLSNFAH